MKAEKGSGVECSTAPSLIADAESLEQKQAMAVCHYVGIAITIIIEHAIDVNRSGRI